MNSVYHEGASDFNWFVRPSGAVSAVMIFVDFPDAPQSESTAELYNLLAPESAQWYAEASYGGMTLEITPVHRWYRMPKNSGEYGFASLTWEKHRAYVADAVALADAEVNFSTYAIVYIVSSKDSQLTVSPTLSVNPGDGIMADGKEIRLAVTVGADVRNATISHYGSNILVHETGHILSLPDLYLYSSNNFLQPAGGWDVMSATLTGAQFLAWHKNKLGWLDASQVQCMSLPGVLEQTITPLETTGGLKAVVIPVSNRKAFVVEVRQLIGVDARLCDDGVLVYSVDAGVASGQGPILVASSASGNDPVLTNRCGPKYNAPFALGSGQNSVFQDFGAALKIEVLSETNEDYRVRITNSRT
ncbi:MAG: M6 family metalloprotease domain-containing protein [Sideroxydans sp.]